MPNIPNGLRIRSLNQTAHVCLRETSTPSFSSPRTRQRHAMEHHPAYTSVSGRI